MSDNRQHHATSDDAEPQNHGSTRVKWWKRPVTWILGIVTALVVAIATSLGTGIGNSILTTAQGHPSSGGPPIKIEHVGQVQTWEDYSFVIPRKVILPAAQLAAMNRQVTTSESTYTNWFLHRGGVIANRATISITVRGNGTGPVTITDMQVVKYCGRPLTNGTLFYSPSEGAGPFGTSQIGFDLGRLVTIGQYIPAPGAHMLSPGGNFFAKEVITLKPGEPRTLSAFVTAEHEYCSFTFQLHVATPDGNSVIEKIADNGKPFHITSDGEPGFSENFSSHVPFSSYSVIYAGGAANQGQGGYGPFIRVNPARYNGTGNPRSVPLAPASAS
jgi:hypothetical protein